MRPSAEALMGLSESDGEYSPSEDRVRPMPDPVLPWPVLGYGLEVNGRGFPAVDSLAEATASAERAVAHGARLVVVRALCADHGNPLFRQYWRGERRY